MNEKQIVINFKSVLSELKNKELKLCLVHDQWWSILDKNENMYQVEVYYIGTYLDKLIQTGTVVTFNLLEKSKSDNIPDIHKEVWDISEVENFIRRHNLQQYIA